VIKGIAVESKFKVVTEDKERLRGGREENKSRDCQLATFCLTVVPSIGERPSLAGLRDY
jgi:hypothetical protein